MFVVLQTHRCLNFVRAMMMTSECVSKKLCIFIIFHIKEYHVKYDVVTNDDLFEVHFNDLNLITLGPTSNSNFISNAML